MDIFTHLMLDFLSPMSNAKTSRSVAYLCHQCTDTTLKVIVKFFCCGFNKVTDNLMKV